MDKYQDEILEFGEKNIFEQFYELIEKHRLSNSNFVLGDFYEVLTEFDHEYQKFNTNSNPKTAQTINKHLVRSFGGFLLLFTFKGFSNRPLFFSFKRFIKWYSILLKNVGNVSSDFFLMKNITSNFPSVINNQLITKFRKNPINFNLSNPDNFDEYFEIIEQVEENISIEFGVIPYAKGEVKNTFFIYGEEFSVQTLKLQEGEFVSIEKNYEMTITTKISNNNNDGAKLISSLNLILASISNIDNVKIEIEQIKVGSLYSRVKVWMKDLAAKEETKAVLETTKEVLVKTVSGGQVSHVEVKKTKADTDKIKAETELLEKELTDKPNDFEAQMSNALDLEKKALENEQMKIKNATDKLAYIERLSGLAQKGILDADDMRIDINEVLYLLKVKDEITSPENNIDEIS